MSAAVAVAGSSLVIRRQTFVGYSAGSRVFAAAAAAAVADVFAVAVAAAVADVFDVFVASAAVA